MIKTYKNDDLTLREKCLNTQFFLVQIRENSYQKKTPYLDSFHAVQAIENISF